MINKYKGIGMIEVLVALLILAIGVLGYVALQVRAVDASGEALTRSQAMMVMRGLTESIRANTAAQADYPAAVRNYTGFSATTNAPTNNCFNALCTSAQLANFDAYQAAKAAFNHGIQLSMGDCPGVPGVSEVVGVRAAEAKRQCLFAAWDKTTLSSATFGYSNCMSSTGVYVTQATCLMLEAY